VAERLIHIYAIYDPAASPHVRYVGRSSNPAARLRSHIDSARRGRKTPLYDWLRKRLDANKRPAFCTLELVPESGWQAAEQKWIYYFRQRQTDLLNLADGGGRIANRLSADHREAISSGLRQAYNEGRRSAKGKRNPMYGRKQSSHQRQVVAQSMAEMRQQPSVRKKLRKRAQERAHRLIRDKHGRIVGWKDHPIASTDPN